MSEAVATVAAAATVAAPPGPASTSPMGEVSIGDLESELLGLAGHIAAAQCRFLQLLAEFDRRDGWAGPGVRSCAHWLSWRAGMSLRTAVEHVRVAHALEALPKITEAFAAGRISYSKVRAITRITSRDTSDTASGTGDTNRDPGDSSSDTTATGSSGGTSGSTGSDGGTDSDGGATAGGVAAAYPALDPAGGPGGAARSEARPAPVQAAAAGPDLLVNAAALDPAVADQVLLDLALSGTAGHVETVVRAVRRRRTPAEDAAARRGLSWQWDQDGSLVLRGRFTPDEGAALIAAVEAVVPPRAPVRHPVPDVEDGWQERAVEEAPGPAVDRIAARRADALLALATGEAEHEDSDEPPRVVARGRAQLIVHVDAGTGSARIDGGPELTPSTAERLACDAQVQLLLDDRQNNRLYLGRRRRLATPAQVAALTARDEGRCQFPGCTHTRHLHAHHVLPWLRGGPTDIDNLVLLCGFHHRVIHDHGYRIRRRSGRWEVRRRDGSPVTATGAALTGNAEGLIEINTRARLRIDRNSLTPAWGGERLDPEPILDALLPRPSRVAA